MEKHAQWQLKLFHTQPFLPHPTLHTLFHTHTLYNIM